MAENNLSEQLVERVLDAANQILEPCGMAQGLSIGMVDMGLIAGVDVKQSDLSLACKGARSRDVPGLPALRLLRA